MRLGFEAIEFVIRKFLAKNKEGIATIPGRDMKDKIRLLVDKYAKLFSMRGKDVNNVTVKEVQNEIDYGMALSKQKRKNIPDVKEGLKPVEGAEAKPFMGFKPKVVSKGVSDEAATSQINKLREDLPRMNRNELDQLIKDVVGRKAYASFDDVQRKELLDAIEYQTTHKPDFASGGLVDLLRL